MLELKVLPVAFLRYSSAAPISAINDVKARELKVTGKVTKAEEVTKTLKVELAINRLTDKEPVEVLKQTVKPGEEGVIKEEISTADAKKFEAGKYEVVLKATAGELEAEDKAEFEIVKEEIDAADKAVEAVKNAKNQIELEKALENELFENVDPAKIADYEQAIKNQTLNTVEDIQELIDEANKKEAQGELLENIIKARDAGVDKDLLAALEAADLKVKDKDGKDVAVEIKTDAVKDYYTALAKGEESKETLTSLENVAKLIDEENKAPLKAVNDAIDANGMKTALSEEKAARLGLDLTAFNELKPEGRQTAALNDLIDNRDLQEDKKYTEETLKTIFDEIVETRTVIQAAMKIYGEATIKKPLEDIEYITMVRDNLESVSYKTISGKEIDKVLEGTAKVEERYDALEGKKVTLKGKTDKTDAIDAQEAVFKTMKYNGKDSYTQATGEFVTALTDVEDLIAPEKAKAEFAELAKKADALGLKEETEDSAYKAAKEAVEKTTGFDEDNAKVALKTFEQVIDLNQAIKDKDAAVLEKALLALEVKYDETNPYADLAKANRLEVAEELIKAEKEPIEKAEVSELCEVYNAYIEKIKNVNEAKTNSDMQTALEAIVGEDKVSLEQAEEFINTFPVDKDGERVPFTTLAAVEAAIK